MQNMMDGKKTGFKKNNMDRFATPTLANLYVQQGHYNQAMAMYRNLEGENIDGPKVKKAIEHLNAVCTNADAKKEQDLANLFLKWIRRIKRHRDLTAS